MYVLERREIREEQIQGCMCEGSWENSIQNIENLTRNNCCSEVRNILVKYLLCANLFGKQRSFEVIYFSLICIIHLQQMDRSVHKTAYFYAVLN